MNRKLIIALTVIGSIALTAGIVNAAATVDVTSMFGTAGDIFRVDGAMKLNSVVIGAQDVGGVTYFNGSIVNNTTTNSVDNPVTFGDNIRIDGRVWRGAEAGTGDTMPFIVNDNMEVTGDLTVASLSGTNLVTQTGEASADDTETTRENPPSYGTLDDSVTLTTGDSTLFCMFSGVFGNSDADGHARVFLMLDGTGIDHTIRRGTSAGAADVFTLSTSALMDVSAGEHTVSVGYNTADVGSTVTAYNHTLDCIEFKN